MVVNTVIDTVACGIPEREITNSCYEEREGGGDVQFSYIQFS